MVNGEFLAINNTAYASTSRVNRQPSCLDYLLIAGGKITAFIMNQFRCPKRSPRSRFSLPNAPGGGQRRMPMDRKVICDELPVVIDAVFFYGCSYLFHFLGYEEGSKSYVRDMTTQTRLPDTSFTS